MISKHSLFRQKDYIFEGICDIYSIRSQHFVFIKMITGSKEDKESRRYGENSERKIYFVDIKLFSKSSILNHNLFISVRFFTFEL